MRAGWLVAGIGLAAVAGSAQGLLGISAVGFGNGTAAASDGSWVCTDVPFRVEIAYLPDSSAIVNFDYLSLLPGDGEGPVGPACVVYNGGVLAWGSVYANTGQTPPQVGWIPACYGDEASGVVCTGSTVSLVVGPSEGLGSLVSLSYSADSTFASSRFVGTFTMI